MTIMTLCGICRPIYSELLEPRHSLDRLNTINESKKLLEPILIKLIEGTYEEPIATSSGRGSYGSHSGHGGYSRGGVARLEGPRGFSVNRGVLGM